MSVHIHAPAPMPVYAETDGHCRAVCRDGRQCGGYHFLVRCHGRSGVTCTCCACGARFTSMWRGVWEAIGAPGAAHEPWEGEYHGCASQGALLRARAQFQQLREETTT